MRAIETLAAQHAEQLIREVIAGLTDMPEAERFLVRLREAASWMNALAADPPDAS